jgi:hypothetical protein
MWTNALRRHWLLTTIAGVSLIANIGFVLEIVSAMTLGKPYGEIVHNLSMGFIAIGPSVLALSVVQAAYVFMVRRPVDPAEANWMRVFRVLSIVNSTIPIIFGAFAFAVLRFGYFWL